MNALETIILNPIFQHVEIDESYPDILTAHGFPKEFFMSSVREIEVGNATVWSSSGSYRALHVYLNQHFKATKTAIGKLYCGIDSNLKEKGKREVDLTTVIDLLRELFHLSVTLKNLCYMIPNQLNICLHI